MQIENGNNLFVDGFLNNRNNLLEEHCSMKMTCDLYVLITPFCNSFCNVFVTEKVMLHTLRGVKLIYTDIEYILRIIYKCSSLVVKLRFF